MTTETAAQRRRREHEQRIRTAPTPIRKLTAAWGWVLSECRKQPTVLAEVHDQIVGLAKRLNVGSRRDGQ